MGSKRSNKSVNIDIYRKNSYGWYLSSILKPMYQPKPNKYNNDKVLPGKLETQIH